MLKLNFIALFFFIQLGAWAQNIVQANIDSCMKAHLSTPTCTALSICYGKQGIPDFCNSPKVTDQKIKACCNKNNCGSGVSDCSRNAPYVNPSPRPGSNSGSNLSCRGRKIDENYLNRLLKSYSQMDSHCFQAGQNVVCCITITKCNGATEVYSLEIKGQDLNTVQRKLSQKSRGNCP